MGNQQNKLERQFSSPSGQNFPANNGSPSNNTNGAVYNPNFVRKSVRGSRGSKRKLKATLAALRHQTMEVDGCIVPFIDGVFIRCYPLRNFVNVQEFEVEGVIAKGAFGNVLRVKGREDGGTYALKAMKKSKIIMDQAVQQCNDEAAIHGAVGHHPFIVHPLHFFQNRDNIYIVMEYIPRGELFSAWKHYGHFSEALVQIYIAELAMVIDFLHHNHVIYRDLKMENVLIDSQGHIQLIDFGLAKWLQFGQRTRTVCGTLQYIAPEVLTMEEYGHSVDWWSLGIMMFALLTGQYPVRGAKDHFEMAEKVMGHEYELPGTHTFSTEARGCVRRLLRQNPTDRLCDLYELESDPFFTSLNFSSLLEKQISPKAHLQRQQSQEHYGFIHSRDQSYDGYLASNLMDAAGAGSVDSLDSLDEFGGFDMTRSQSVDGLFTDTRQQVQTTQSTTPKQPSQQQQQPLSRSSSHDQLLSSPSHPPQGPPPPPRKVTDFYLPPPPSTPPSSLAAPGSRSSFDRERLGRMGGKQIPMVNALLQEANRTSATSTEVADKMGRTAQIKRVRDPPRERIEFDPIPVKSRVVEVKGSGRQRQSWQEREEEGEEDYRQATRNAAAKIANRRSKSVDMLGGGSVSSKRLSTSDAPPPPPRLYNPKSYLNKSVDGVSNAPTVRVRAERSGRSSRAEGVAHKKTGSKDSSNNRGSLDNLSHCTNRGSLEDLNPPPPRPMKTIALADLHHHQLDKFMESGHRHSYHPTAVVVANTNLNDAQKRRSNPDFNFNAMHKKAISPSPQGEVDVNHRRMESLTGETTHHVDKVREWLCSTPDVETMERYEFEHDIDVPTAATDDEVRRKESTDVNQKQSKEAVMPGSADNRMQFIDQQANIAKPKVERTRMHSASALLESSSNKVTRPSPQKPHSTDLSSKEQSQVPQGKAREKEKENQPPPPPPPQPSVLRSKAQQLSPQEDYPPYLSSHLSQSTQALFERMSKASQKPTNATQQSLYVYRYSDSTNVTPTTASQTALQRASQISSTPSGKDVHSPLQIVTTDTCAVVSDNSNRKDYNNSNVTFGAGATASQQTLSSPVSSYATVIEHSVTSETNTTSNNRNSYVNEKDWAKALENLGLAGHKDPKVKSKAGNLRSVDSSRHNTPSPAKHPSRAAILETDFPATRSQSEWQQPRLRSVKVPPCGEQVQQPEQHSSSSRSTPSSAHSAPQHGYVNHRQVNSRSAANEDVGHANIGNQRHSYTDAQKVLTREFCKIPAKPPRRSPGENSVTIREKAGSKDGFYMEINEARRLLYEGHPPDPALALSSSSVQSFGTVTEEKTKARSKSASNMAEDAVKNNTPNVDPSLVVRSHSVEDNLGDKQRLRSQMPPSKELRSPVISNSSSQVSISQATAKSSSSEARTGSPGKVRSSTHSPMDNLWQQITSRSTLRPSPAPYHSAGADMSHSQAHSSSRSMPISPQLSQGEPAQSRKQQRMTDGQSEESGYTSMGNSRGSKEGLGSPQFEAKTRATFPTNPQKTAPPPPPVKPKPKMERPKQVDTMPGQSALLMVDTTKNRAVRDNRTGEASVTSPKYPVPKPRTFDSRQSIQSPSRESNAGRAQKYPAENVNLSTSSSSMSLQHNTHSTSSLNGLLQTDFPDVEHASSYNHANEKQTARSLAPKTEAFGHLKKPQATVACSVYDSRVAQASLAQSPSQYHTENTRVSLSPSPAARHPPIQLSRTPSPSPRKVPTQLSLVPSTEVGQTTAELISPSTGIRKPAIAKKPLVLTSPQHSGPKPMPRTKSPTKVHFSSELHSPNKAQQNFGSEKPSARSHEYLSRPHDPSKPHEYLSREPHDYASSQKSAAHVYSASSLGPATTTSSAHEQSSLSCVEQQQQQQQRLSVCDTLDSGRYTASTRDVSGAGGCNTSGTSGTPFSDNIQQASLHGAVAVDHSGKKRRNEAESKPETMDKALPPPPPPLIVNQSPDNSGLPKNIYVNLDYSHARSKAAEKMKSPTDESKNPQYVNLAYNEIPPSLPPKSVQAPVLLSPPLPAKSRSVSESTFLSHAPVTSLSPHMQANQRSQSVGDRALTSPTQLATSHDSIESFSWTNVVADQNASFV